jgi:hypothetical protein
MTVHILIIMQSKEQLTKSSYHIFCDVCGEDLGVERMYWAQEHLKKYPTHLRYKDKNVSLGQTA